ncbi:DCA17 factor, partial [Nycticryphes semicollaris]|nr:DCA17 factor [Nycticryphes semicollaris]
RKRRVASRAAGAHNVCCLLSRRAHGFYARDAGVAHRKNLGLLRKIICQESTKFKKVWTTHSASPIAYERGRIYLDNYQCCISSIAREPRILYQKPKCSKSEKIEDALLLECPLGEMLPSPSDYKSSLIVLTVQNWLLRLSADSGEILEKIYLAGSCCKFRYLSWDTPQEVMVVKSAQNKLPAAARQAGIQQSVMFYLAVFQVLPLSFIGMLEINKKIFGSSVTDVAVSNGILIVMHSMGLVRLYNFQAICEQFMEQPFDLGHEFNWNGQVGVVGKYPFGLPCNIKITDTPPLLFEASSLENAFQIGGYPWHYIITPNKKKHKGVFHICSLKDNALVIYSDSSFSEMNVQKNGVQDMKCCSLESDWIYFHPDMSGRIIHVGPSLIKVLKLKEVKNNTDQVEVAEDFTIVADRENCVNNAVTVTASGRVVKKRFNLLDDDPEQETFKIVDYEDELDLLSTVAVTEIGADGKAHLDFHCNDYGILLKSIPLLESWDVTYSHEVYFDKDLVLHIEQKPNRRFSCYVYQMVCDTAKEDECSSPEKTERAFCKKGGRIFEYI